MTTTGLQRPNSKSLVFALCFISFTQAEARAEEASWSIQKVENLLVKAERAAQKNKLKWAILYSRKAVKGAVELWSTDEVRYILLLNRYHGYLSRANKLAIASVNVEAAYTVAKEKLGVAHTATADARQLYYKLLIADGLYAQAIPLTLESIRLTKIENQDTEETLHYLKQLFSLYGLTGQGASEETVLAQMLELAEKLKIEETMRATILLSLAKNYCVQRKIDKFESLVEHYQLKYFCGRKKLHTFGR